MKVGEHMAGRGKKLFKNKDVFFEEILNYFDSIYYEQDEEDSRPETATFYGFYRYMHDKTGCSYRTIRRCFDEYWTDIKKDFEEIRADLLVRGAAKGKYNPTIVIFALKNWCKWTDKQEVTAEVQTLDSREKQAEYIRNVLKGENECKEE